MFVRIALLLSVALSIPVGPAAGAAEDSILVNPSLYRVVLENDQVRVTELLAPAGSGAATHAQPAAVMVSVAKARFEVTATDGEKSIIDLDPGQVEWIDPTEHGWHLLAGEAHVFFVEVASAANGDVPEPVAPDPGDSVAIDPEHHHVVLENPHVRVWDGMAEPGDRSPVHGHPPSVLVSLAKARLRVTIEGRTRIFDFDPSRVYWIGSFEHTWEALTGRARVIGIEVKSARLPDDGGP